MQAKKKATTETQSVVTTPRMSAVKMMR